MKSQLDIIRRRWVIVAVGLLALAGVGPLVVEPMARNIRLTRTPKFERDRSSAIVQAFRGLQMSLADICYAKSTEYQHSGIIYRTPCEDTLDADIREERQQTDAALEGGTASPAPAGKPAKTAPKKPVPSKSARQEPDHDHEGHDHEHEHATMIPPKEADFRGIIGHVEREVKPFSLTHAAHSKPEEALPWLRLATWINPEHEMSWVAMAFWLQRTRKGGRNPQAVEQAIELLERARALNPPQENQPFAKQGLIYMLGHLYLMEKKDYAKAIEVLEPAIKRGEADFAKLDAVQRDWLSFSFRDAVEAYKNLGQTDKAMDLAARGIVLFPDDGPLRTALRRMKNPPKSAGKSSSGKK
ncbi:MAG: tetratricopeptide repeat protein [Candidatus Sumerlaeia bacterium]|nr:tetratricopeptide repeat protein [Candidatus Sumerlaeia bacterium]